MCNCPGAGLWFAGMIALALGWSALPDILTGLAYAAAAAVPSLAIGWAVAVRKYHNMLRRA